MGSPRRIAIVGQPLRYLLTIALIDAGRPLTIAELVDMVDRLDLEVTGRPSKVISDTLRWERRRGRVIRIGRSTYIAGMMPASTARWIRMQVRRTLA